MQVLKQPEHGTTSTTKEQKWSSFQINQMETGCKSIIRNNLGLCKLFEIYLIWNFQQHCDRSNGINIWQGKMCQTN